MENNISDLELTLISELISIANEFKGKEYQSKISRLDGELKEKYNKTKPTVTYSVYPEDSNGHHKSSVELRYVVPDEEITVWFMDKKFCLASIPNNFNERIKNKLNIKKE